MNLKGPPGELNEEGGSSTQYCVWWRARADGAQDLSIPLASSTEPRTGGSASVLAEMNRTELSSGEGCSLSSTSGPPHVHRGSGSHRKPYVIFGSGQPEVRVTPGGLSTWAGR